MKAIEYKLNEETYYLVFNGAAMFEFDDHFGGAGNLLDAVKTVKKDTIERLCEATAILAEQGELVRRTLGYDKGPIPTLEQIKTVATPLDVIGMRTAVINAVMAGYGREIEADEDTDLVLLELSQKKTSV